MITNPRPAAVPPRIAPMLHHLEAVMGTVVTIDLYVEEAIEARDVRLLLKAACAELHEADRVFSTWHPHSPISRLRRGEISLDQMPPVATEVLIACAKARELSGGWFDPWEMPGGVDPTGYVKGWAAQRACNALVSNLVVGAVVNASGDIFSIGSPGGMQGFRFGVIDPADTGALLCVVEPLGALATSGTYERGAHLIDPFTRQPACPVASASVTGADLGIAYALATGLAVAGQDGLSAIEGIEGYEAMIVSLDGRMLWSQGFPVVAVADRSTGPQRRSCGPTARLRYSASHMNPRTPCSARNQKG